MDQDHEAEPGRREELARTRDAAKPDEAGKRMRKQIDPERLSKAVRYLKQHPGQRLDHFQARIFHFLNRT
jgi:hypothetical protein